MEVYGSGPLLSVGLLRGNKGYFPLGSQARIAMSSSQVAEKDKTPKKL